MASTPRIIASGVVGSTGNLNETVAFPLDTETGDHTLTLSVGNGPVLSTKIYFTAAPSGLLTNWSTAALQPTAALEPADATSEPSPASTVPQTDTVSGAAAQNDQPAGQTTDAGQLALTGTNTGRLSIAATLVLLIGTALLITRRRRTDQ
jgi:LPXTG-motif cell wall-anchored protein